MIESDASRPVSGWKRGIVEDCASIVSPSTFFVGGGGI